MNNSTNELKKHLYEGHVYRRETLQAYSSAIDRDLHDLTEKGILQKVATGIYYKPRNSEFGALPPKPEEVVSCFLKTSNFLILYRHDYNSLGVGLTQLYNRVIVLNSKRHGLFKLGSQTYEFIRPNNGYPNKLTREFLVVDLLNNLNNIAEDTTQVKLRIKNKIADLDMTLLKKLANRHGKVATKKFLMDLLK